MIATSSGSPRSCGCTATATPALVREGLLELDEPVDRLLPELANRRVLRRMDGPLDDTLPAEGPVTVWRLLTFTFGFGMALEVFTAPEPWPVVAAARKAGLATIGPPPLDDFVDPPRRARLGARDIGGARRSWAGAIGWDGGLGALFLVHPARDLAVIVLTQRLFETAQAPAVHTDLKALAAAE